MSFCIKPTISTSRSKEGLVVRGDSDADTAEVVESPTKRAGIFRVCKEIPVYLRHHFFKSGVLYDENLGNLALCEGKLLKTYNGDSPWSIYVVTSVELYDANKRVRVSEISRMQ